MYKGDYEKGVRDLKWGATREVTEGGSREDCRRRLQRRPYKHLYV